MNTSVRVDNTMEEKEQDFLENDTPIPGQNYVCLSFVSPESCIEDRKLWDFYHYMTKQDEENKTSFEQFRENFETFCVSNNDALQKNYSERNDFVTSVRGIKVRGVYDNVVEAKYRAKQLQRTDPHFNVFVGQVGFWLPWDPSPGDIPEQEYLNAQLNTLMKSYKDNQSNKDQMWAENKHRMMEQARANNSTEETNAASVEEKLNSMEDEDPWMKKKMQK